MPRAMILLPGITQADNGVEEFFLNRPGKKIYFLAPPQSGCTSFSSPSGAASSPSPSTLKKLFFFFLFFFFLSAIYQDSGARFVEVKGYMYLGYSRKPTAD